MNKDHKYIAFGNRVTIGDIIGHLRSLPDDMQVVIVDKYGNVSEIGALRVATCLVGFEIEEAQ